MNCPKCGAEPYNGSSGQSWECGSYETYGKFIQFWKCELQQEREAHNATKAENARLRDALQRITEYQGRFGEDDPQSIAADILANASRQEGEE